MKKTIVLFLLLFCCLKNYAGDSKHCLTLLKTLELIRHFMPKNTDCPECANCRRAAKVVEKGQKQLREVIEEHRKCNEGEACKEPEKLKYWIKHMQTLDDRNRRLL